MARAVFPSFVLLISWAAACSDDAASPGPAEADSGPPIQRVPDDAQSGSDAPASDAAPATKPGTVQWAKHFVESGTASATAVATDKAGNVFIAGELTGTVNFAGTGPSGVEALTSATTVGFLAKLGSSGQHLWSKKWAATGGSVSTVSMTTDPSGSVLFAGRTNGSVSFGGAPIVVLGAGAAFVAKLDANGNQLWVRGFENGAGTSSRSLAVDTGGDVILAGTFFNTLNLASPADPGAPTLTSAGGPDYFLVKLASNDGHHLWSRRYGDTFGQLSIRVAVDTKNSVTIAGATFGTVDFGGGPLSAALGNAAGFIAHFDSAGGHLWSKGLPDAAPLLVATAANDDIVYGGSFRGMVDFAGTGTAGGNALTAKSTSDSFLTKLGTSGAHAWSRGFGETTTAPFASGVAVDASGRATTVGFFAKNPVAFSAGGVAAAPLTCAGDQNLFIASFDPAGAHRWSFCAGTSGATVQGAAIAADPSGNVLAVGSYAAAASLSFPQATPADLVLARNGVTDIFLVKVTP